MFAVSSCFLAENQPYYFLFYPIFNGEFVKFEFGFVFVLESVSDSNLSFRKIWYCLKKEKEMGERGIGDKGKTRKGIRKRYISSYGSRG